MGVYIKDMDMPISCSDCKIRLSVGCCGNLPQNARMPNCPLIEVPRHGRLIDADALLKEAYGRLLLCTKYKIEFQNPYEILRAIETAPTVIPEEQETEP